MAALIGASQAGKSVGKKRLNVELGDFVIDSATECTSVQAWPALWIMPGDSYEDTASLFEDMDDRVGCG